MIIELSKIRIDGKTQPRVSISNETIATYSEVLDDGGKFPPVKLFFDGADYWLADGFHRYHAHNKSGHTQIDGDVTKGTRQDAFVYSLGANYNHGLPRTIDDKRKSVTSALAEFKNISARQIADICKVSHTFVQRVQKSLEIVQKEKQPVPPPEPKPVVPPPPSLDDGAHDLAVELQSLVDENNELRDQLLVKQSTIKESAKEEVSRTIKELRDRIRQLELELESVTKSRNEYQNKSAEAIKQVAYWKRRAEKSEKIAA
jgi:hypothetical protein